MAEQIKKSEEQRVSASANTDRYGLTAEEMNKRELLRPGPPTAHQLQGLDNLATS